MEGIGQAILDMAGTILPAAAVFDPTSAMGNVGPGADVRDAGDQGVDIAVHPVEAGHHARHPVAGQPAVALHEVLEDAAEQPGVGVGHDFLVVGNAADIPQQMNGVGGCRQAGDFVIAGQGFKGEQVVGVVGAAQTRPRRRLIKAPNQAGEGLELEP